MILNNKIRFSEWLSRKLFFATGSRKERKLLICVDILFSVWVPDDRNNGEHLIWLTLYWCLIGPGSFQIYPAGSVDTMLLVLVSVSDDHSSVLSDNIMLSRLHLISSQHWPYPPHRVRGGGRLPHGYTVKRGTPTPAVLTAPHIHNVRTSILFRRTLHMYVVIIGCTWVCKIFTIW